MGRNNWLMPVGIALLVVNLILTVLLIIVGLPPLNKMNQLVSSMNQVINIDNRESIGVEYDINQLSIVQFSEPISVTLQSQSTDKASRLRFTIGFAINNKSKDSKKITETLNEKQAMIINDIRSLAANKSYEDISKANGDKELAQEITEYLRKLLSTDAIVNVVFEEFIYN
jgi:flagellar basal body-associated protein FliL